mmetsp:Transcript_40471/g.114624  ORF Transcript_40471/g.114624 Transcript_40471/m.114624 type:complete len:101 (-) Transcript_40471:142-444(-)|eukprot:CAMPEP_0117680410 /NCGR_PEP_ID=MMETSP0804-20121206/18338_1 /TAXON_ID=1074897 /ORGANISM="Tetraselmis astigmatica, Strain CCMP880" /LENGTH=100 /DNA_ID=CAMNT_0005489907 /DNA_START=182 /DNA_END=484 /DNA_ORIENTATION=-
MKGRAKAGSRAKQKTLKAAPKAKKKGAVSKKSTTKKKAKRVASAGSAMEVDGGNVPNKGLKLSKPTVKVAKPKAGSGKKKGKGRAAAKPTTKDGVDQMQD